MLKKLLNAVLQWFHQKPKDDVRYVFSDNLKCLLPQKESVYVALDFARYVEYELDVPFTGVEILMYIASQDYPTTAQFITDEITHVSKGHAKRLLSQMTKREYIVKHDGCIPSYSLSQKTVDVFKKYT